MSADQWEFLNNCIKKSTDKDNNDFMKFNSSNLGFVRKNNIPQMVPQPSGLPWSISRMPWGSLGNGSSPVEFTATLNDGNKYSSDNKMFSNLPCKRKSEVEMDGPRKQLITEEKMSASFGGMHISCNYTSHNIDTSQGEDGAHMDQVMQGPRIVLSPEIMKVQPEPILPPSLIHRIEKPCTSLVLWQPPTKILPPLQSQDSRDPNNNPGSGKGGRRRRGVLEEIARGGGQQEGAYNMDIEM